MTSRLYGMHSPRTMTSFDLLGIQLDAAITPWVARITPDGCPVVWRQRSLYS
jgi:hypothetical protein